MSTPCASYAKLNSLPRPTGVILQYLFPTNTFHCDFVNYTTWISWLLLNGTDSFLLTDSLNLISCRGDVSGRAYRDAMFVTGQWLEGLISLTIISA